MSTKYKQRLRLKLTFLNLNPLTVEKKKNQTRTGHKTMHTPEKARESAAPAGPLFLRD